METYIGDPVEHESERSMLREIEQLLAGDVSQAVVFANLSVASCQIDLLVALDGQAMVADAAKTSAAQKDAYARSGSLCNPPGTLRLPARKNLGSDLPERPVCASEGRFRGGAPAPPAVRSSGPIRPGQLNDSPLCNELA